MNFKCLSIHDISNQEEEEIIIAWLSEIGFDMFEESHKGIKAYVIHENFDEQLLNECFDRIKSVNSNITFQLDEVPDINYNQIWEQSFEPVNIDNRVFIHAEFQPANPSVPYNISITPKMAFGTGHHQTTEMMVSEMLRHSFEGKRVLDMGCGTAVLAILALKLGAAQVLGIDYDQQAIENAIENLKVNQAESIQLKVGDVELIEGSEFDVILANINRNILMAHMKSYSNALSNCGVLLLSGFYSADLESIINHAASFQLVLHSRLCKDDWNAALFYKK
ncbi:MAG TPA: 50S ribosomal protein L11 methyltransferase [Bacteroidia bacterium]|nr:50S ribosomal protein L11 methyltransferase [Bacteroidia bacterium]HNT79930.1 50S ribosomal protein L11 methyltransferase [Bacteroidia bacterium]